MMATSDTILSVISCIFRGNFGACFRSPRGNNCVDMPRNKAYGWCNDADNYGMLPGTASGPFGTSCIDWVWNKKDCPPVQCKGTYPYGLGGQKPYQTWGWCADPGVNRAMRGRQCGPINGEVCNHWIWDPSTCPDTCPTRVNAAKLARDKKTAKDGTVCNRVCGLVNGVEIPCPPKCYKPKQKKTCTNICGVMKNGAIVDCPPPAGSGDKCICKR